MDPQVLDTIVTGAIGLGGGLAGMGLQRWWSTQDRNRQLAIDENERARAEGRLREERAHSIQIIDDERGYREREQARMQAERDREARTALLYGAEFDATNEVSLALTKFARLVQRAMHLSGRDISGSAEAEKEAWQMYSDTKDLWQDNPLVLPGLFRVFRR